MPVSLKWTFAQWAFAHRPGAGAKRSLQPTVTAALSPRQLGPSPARGDQYPKLAAAKLDAAIPDGLRSRSGEYPIPLYVPADAGGYEPLENRGTPLLQWRPARSTASIRLPVSR